MLPTNSGPAGCDPHFLLCPALGIGQRGCRRNRPLGRHQTVMSLFWCHFSSKFSRLLFSYVADFGMVPPSTDRSQVRDARAEAMARWNDRVGDELIGQLVNRRGEPLANRTIELLQNNQIVGTPISAANGKFRAKKLTRCHTVGA